MISGRFARAVNAISKAITSRFSRTPAPAEPRVMQHVDPVARAVPFTGRRRPENTRNQRGARGRRRQRSALRRSLACMSPQLPPQSGSRRPEFSARAVS